MGSIHFSAVINKFVLSKHDKICIKDIIIYYKTIHSSRICGLSIKFYNHTPPIYSLQMFIYLYFLDNKSLVILVLHLAYPSLNYHTPYIPYYLFLPTIVWSSLTLPPLCLHLVILPKTASSLPLYTCPYHSIRWAFMFLITSSPSEMSSTLNLLTFESPSALSCLDPEYL